MPRDPVIDRANRPRAKVDRPTYEERQRRYCMNDRLLTWDQWKFSIPTLIGTELIRRYLVPERMRFLRMAWYSPVVLVPLTFAVYRDFSNGYATCRVVAAQKTEDYFLKLAEEQAAKASTPPTNPVPPQTASATNTASSS